MARPGGRHRRVEIVAGDEWYVSVDAEHRWHIYNRQTALPYRREFEPQWWFTREEALTYARNHGLTKEAE